ncbi:hypothetical protein SSBR45G_49860 [Bradyrhizobium sp. SSBR45G]|uniref:hypothetical protein n=1 Tax=unclassified Bradyrhizobium TaxID=2631580 RepID=UPI002342A71C|nr:MULTISPECIES: hypothetical protein [unclassified Bradyrhizobium]GLH80077.1 hypothetical protein SSBR45G_49860 [Bradyrhizobium sp. SSBR45G]GLH87614.1 hypothetical protein SSBR45R_50740 [Bradyrhizobium sp. SSBR45R]
MRAYAEELNRLNRERRASGDAWRAELLKVEKHIQGIVEAVKEGLFQRSMIAATDTREACKEELTALLAEAPADTPDMLASASQLYARKVAHLTALNRPVDRAEAAQALRGLIDRIMLRPGAKRGQIEATLHGKLGPVLGWTAAHRNKKHIPKLPQPRWLREFRIVGCGDLQPSQIAIRSRCVRNRPTKPFETRSAPYTTR